MNTDLYTTLQPQDEDDPEDIPETPEHIESLLSEITLKE